MPLTRHHKGKKIFAGGQGDALSLHGLAHR